MTDNEQHNRGGDSDMDMNGAGSVGSLDSQQGMLVAKKALDAMKAEGQMALKLVETAAATAQVQVQSPQNPEGTGKIVDLHV